MNTILTGDMGECEEGQNGCDDYQSICLSFQNKYLNYAAHEFTNNGTYTKVAFKE